jgi:hypothetical protein
VGVRGTGYAKPRRRRRGFTESVRCSAGDYGRRVSLPAESRRAGFPTRRTGYWPNPFYVMPIKTAPSNGRKL